MNCWETTRNVPPMMVRAMCARINASNGTFAKLIGRVSLFVLVSTARVLILPIVTGIASRKSATASRIVWVWLRSLRKGNIACKPQSRGQAIKVTENVGKRSRRFRPTAVAPTAAGVRETRNTRVCFLEVPCLTAASGERILNGWLQAERRALTPSQRGNVLSAFAQCPLPLFLRLATDLTGTWKSWVSICFRFALRAVDTVRLHRRPRHPTPTGDACNDSTDSHRRH